VETRAGKDLSSFHFPEGRTESFQAPHDVANELGKAIDRFGQLDERIRTFLLETPHPGSDGERAHQEDSSRLGEGPATGGTKFEDCESRSRRIMGPSMRLQLFHSGILDANLFSQELDLLPQPVLFSLLTKLRVHALGGPALSQCQGGPGERDDLDDRRADPTGPSSG